MAKQTINLGSMANNKSGDPLRTAFQKINENFTELYARDAGDFDGSYISLTDKPIIPEDISDLTDTGNLLGQGGNANTGNVTFNNVTVFGAETQAVGAIFFFPTNDEGGSDNKGASGVALPINSDSQQIQTGWVARFDSGEVYTVNQVFEANGAINLTMNNGTSFSATLPVTVESPDYVAYAPAQLLLKADNSEWAKDYGVKVFNSIDNDTHLSPVTRDKGIALGFAYGQGSHVRVEGTNGQGGVPGSGDRVGIVATDGEQSAEWTFEKDGSLNKDGANILGTLVFDGNNIIPKTVFPTGTRYNFATNYIDNNLAIDGSSLQFPGMAPFQWIETGMVIAFADNQTTRTVTAVRAQDGFIFVDFDSPVTLDPAYPLTVSSANYDPGVPPRLSIVLGASQVWFDEDGNINIPPDATIQDYYGNDKLGGTKVTAKSYVDTTVELDLTATINKIQPSNAGNPVYNLSDGYEGQIMHLVCAGGGEVNSEYTTVNIVNGRSSNANGIINQFSNWWWLPFRTGATCVTLVFVDGAWTLPHNLFD